MSSIALASRSADSALPAIPRHQPGGNYFDALLRRLLMAPNGVKGSRAPRVIGLTGCARGVGVSTVAINLAIRAAQLGTEQVLLVDADLRRATLGRMLRIEPKSGGMTARSGVESFRQYLHDTRVERLSVLCGGENGAAGAPEVKDLAECLRALRGEYGLMIVDLPPADEWTTGFEMVGVLDGVVLMIEAEKTRDEEAQRVKRKLLDAQAHLLGVVLNKRRTCLPKWLYRR